MTYPPELIEDFEKKFPPSANIRRKGGNSGYVSAGSSDYMQEAREWTLIYKGFAANWERVKELEEQLKDSEAAANCLARHLEAINSGQTVTVLYDLSPAMAESEVRNKLIALGWKPPELLEKGNE